jgi:hypothetical protein
MQNKKPTWVKTLIDSREKLIKKPNISQKNSKQKLKNKRKWIKYKIEKKQEK